MSLPLCPLRARRRQIKGEGLKTKIGTVIDAREIGGSKDKLHRLEAKKSKDEKKEH